MPNGLTTDQMVDRMYTELVGLDGKSGMVKDVKDDHAKIEELEDTTVKKTECKEIREKVGNRKDKILMRGKDLLLLILAVITVLVALGVIGK